MPGINPQNDIHWRFLTRSNKKPAITVHNYVHALSRRIQLGKVTAMPDPPDDEGYEEFRKRYDGFFRSCAPNVIRRLMRETQCGWDEAQDATMTACCELISWHRRHRKFDFDDKLEYVWLYRRALFRYLDDKGPPPPRTTTENNAYEPADPGDGLFEHFCRDDLCDQVKRVLRELPPIEQRLLICTFWLDMTQDDIAELEGITRDKVRWLIKKAKKHFVCAWRRLYGDEP
jgi:RNA polymerase sigma factor (sigma-70 family)